MLKVPQRLTMLMTCIYLPQLNFINIVWRVQRQIPNLSQGKVAENFVWVKSARTTYFFGVFFHLWAFILLFLPLSYLFLQNFSTFLFCYFPSVPVYIFILDFFLHFGVLFCLFCFLSFHFFFFHLFCRILSSSVLLHYYDYNLSIV